MRVMTGSSVGLVFRLAFAYSVMIWCVIAASNKIIAYPIQEEQPWLDYGLPWVNYGSPRVNYGSSERTLTEEAPIDVPAGITDEPQPYPTCLEQKGPCSCETDQGLIDLSPIDSNDPNEPYFHDVQFAGETYSYNPCTPFSNVMFPRCNEAAVCDCYNPTCLLIGTHSSAQFKTDPDTNKLTIEYSHVDGLVFRSIVTLECDESRVGTLEAFTGYSPYQFTLTSKYACPRRGGGDGLSIGSYLVIAFFSLAALYLIGGVLYMRFVKSAVGIEMIPNVNFWKNLPSTIREGMSLIISPCRRKVTGYDQI